ncbi:MAG: hypothetical protein KC492_34650, partial [Myxococcales bacterium]|nr:hypothetical protein [Myxococcales bacterium]
MNLVLELWCPDLPQTFRLLRLSGFDAISECFDFSLEFAPPDSEIDVDACLKPGTRAAVVFKRHGEVIRVMHGCLIELEHRSG